MFTKMTRVIMKAGESQESWQVAAPGELMVEFQGECKGLQTKRTGGVLKFSRLED